MQMADYTWKNITEIMIRNCFIKAEFLEYVTSSEAEKVIPLSKQLKKEELNLEQ